MTISNETMYSGTNTYTAKVMQKMSTLSAQSLHNDLDVSERTELKSEMVELKSILVEIQNSAAAKSDYDDVNVARRLNSINVTDTDIASSLVNIVSQASQALQAQANQTNESVLALCTN